jgi:diadenosine tetraphosphate (Ap4A) HIT family hydrolase
MGRRHRRQLLRSGEVLTSTFRWGVDKVTSRTYVRAHAGTDPVLSDQMSWMGKMKQEPGARAQFADSPAVRITPAPACSTCGFSLWIPIATLSVSRVGLYDDARFPGRLIVSVNEHVEHYDQADPEVLSAFMSDLQDASLVLRKMGDVERVNIAVLGNKDPHLHAHVIPRRVADTNYGVSPWENATAPSRMTPTDRTIIVDLLKQGFNNVSSATTGCLC